MNVFNPTKVNTYTIGELLNFYVQGVSFEAMASVGLNHRKQEELRAEIQSDNEDWNAALILGTIEGFKFYLKKHPTGIHAYEARVKIDELEELLNKLKEELVADMKSNPKQYPYSVMRSLLQVGHVDTSNLNASDDVPSRFLRQGGKIDMDFLINNDVIPDNRDIQQAITQPDHSVIQRGIDELGKYPLNRTDIYFLGIPTSGKSCVLAALFYHLHYATGATYVPQLNEEGIDYCAQYYEQLKKAISIHKVPESTQKNTISFIQMDMEVSKKVNKITFMEISGESFINIADTTATGADVWNELGAGQCLKNNNGKSLFFVIDYSYADDRSATFDQSNILSRSLTLFCTDGTGKDHRTGCTMSKVDTVSIIVTKSDLMKDAKNFDDRLRIAHHYLKDEYPNFMDNLEKACREFGINKPINGKVYVIPFSIGRLYVGNTVIYEDEYAKRLKEHIIKTTPFEKTHYF
jgi:hypothetical protein